MLTYNDWANTGWRFFKATQSIGLPIEFYKCVSHTFGYPIQAEVPKALKGRKTICKYPLIVKAPELKLKVEQADIVYFIASTLFETGANLSNKNVIVQHGGYTYRHDPNKSNKLFNPIVSHTIIQSVDLLGLGAKNEHYFAFPVDTDFIQPNFKTNNPLKIGHFPSNSMAKGTKYIVETMDKLNLLKQYVGKKAWYDKKAGWANWEDNLKRTSECDIIIEKMQPTLIWGANKLSGEFGNSAIEAAALGKIVITCSYNPKIYQKEYGNHPLIIANNQKQLEKRLKRILSLNEKEILNLKEKTRQWAKEKHSIKATGRRLWEKIYGCIDVNKT